MKRCTSYRFALVMITVGVFLQGCAGPALIKEQSSLLQAAEAAGAQSVTVKPLDDGGLLLNGKIDGRAFSLAVPWRWNKQAMVFANGYRSPGLPTDIGKNPLSDDENGFYRVPYAQGFAVGRAEYDKAGMGVQTGVERTHRLKQLLDQLGATRVYVMGGSMGGDITVALVEKYPGEFAGALAACGAVGGWPAEIEWANDVRAAYNYFTRGTPYELPGDKDLARSAVSAMPTLPKLIALPLFFVEMKRLIKPVIHLFEVAAANPQGPESRMIDNIAAVAGTARDSSAFVLPLALVTMGTDDMNEVFGGSIYDNSAKRYSSPSLSAEENAALNAGIQRIKSDPQAVARANAWYTPTGVFNSKLMTIYNEIDPLAPSTIHEPILRAAAEHAGNLDSLVQRSLPSQRKKVPTSETEGYAHCGFTADQVEAAWNDLRAWVELGKKPQPESIAP